MPATTPMVGAWRAPVHNAMIATRIAAMDAMPSAVDHHGSGPPELFASFAAPSTIMQRIYATANAIAVTRRGVPLAATP